MDPNPATNPPANEPPAAAAPAPEPPPGDAVYGSKWWLPYVLPFVVYMLVGMCEPPPPDPVLQGLDESWLPHEEPTLVSALGIEYEHYPVIYSIKIGATVLTMLVCLPAYRKFPFHVSWLAIGVGVGGVVLWILLCHPWVNEHILAPVGLMSLEKLGERPAYNPLELLKDDPTWAYTFLAIRFLGLALIVPIIEEFFLRGWLMRYVMHPDWWEIPFGKVNFLAVIAGTGVPMLMHPGELLASFVWFSLVTWLMVRTKNIWDCVAAHAVTNLLLGIYVVTTGNWWLW